MSTLAAAAVTCYVPTAEKMAALGYAPDAELSSQALNIVAYSRQVPAPVAPWFNTVTVQATGFDTVFLFCHGRQLYEPWRGWPIATELFFEQLLQSLGWPTSPA